jgi:hypothetical protein
MKTMQNSMRTTTTVIIASTSFIFPIFEPTLHRRTTTMSKCYHCGRKGIMQRTDGNFYCVGCDTVFYRATGTIPYYTPYYAAAEMQK